MLPSTMYCMLYAMFYFKAASDQRTLQLVYSHPSQSSMWRLLSLIVRQDCQVVTLNFHLQSDTASTLTGLWEGGWCRGSIFFPPSQSRETNYAYPCQHTHKSVERRETKVQCWVPVLRRHLCRKNVFIKSGVKSNSGL